MNAPLPTSNAIVLLARYLLGQNALSGYPGALAQMSRSIRETVPGQPAYAQRRLLRFKLRVERNRALASNGHTTGQVWL